MTRTTLGAETGKRSACGCRRPLALGVAALLLLSSGPPVRAEGPRVLWAWERPEHLPTLPAGVGVAAVVGFIRLRGDAIDVMRGRRFPLQLAAAGPAPMAVVHVEIDQTVPLAWTEALRERVVSAALAFSAGYAAVQVDMEVRQSQRRALLEVLGGVRAGLPPGTRLSMTALASWCDGEAWLADAPVDEIVPMLFRMGRDGLRLRTRLAAGGDFRLAACRGAVGVSLDAPVTVPPRRRVYVFNPRPWDDASLSAALGGPP